jgi:hypothetical protein
LVLTALPSGSVHPYWQVTADQQSRDVINPTADIAISNEDFIVLTVNLFFYMVMVCLLNIEYILLFILSSGRL